MSNQNVCPICAECVNSTKNCVITQCGHCFHTKCLMTNVAINNFNCPCCRTPMTDKIEKKETNPWEIVEDTHSIRVNEVLRNTLQPQNINDWELIEDEDSLLDWEIVEDLSK